MKDLREWIATAREARRAGAHRRAGRPGARDHRDRRPRLQGRRSGPAVHQRDRQPAAGAHQPVRHGPADVHGARHREPRRAGRADRVADGPAAAPGRGGQDEGAGQAARAGVVLVEDRQGRPLPGGLAGRAGPRPAADPHLLARRRRPVRHAAAGLQPRPGDAGAQLRHVPHPEGRPAHRDDALADPQGRRGPPARLAGAGARGGGDRLAPGHDLLGHGAAAPRDRRDDLRGLPARQERRDGALPHGRPRGAGGVRGRASRATSTPTTSAPRGPSATTPASTPRSTTTRRST